MFEIFVLFHFFIGTHTALGIFMLPGGSMAMPAVRPTANVVQGPRTFFSQQWPDWLLKEDCLPSKFKEWLSLCGNPDWPNTAVVYNLLVASGLPRETLGHIWALVNRTYTGQLVKQEFYAAMILVALAQVRKGLQSLSKFYGWVMNYEVQ